MSTQRDMQLADAEMQIQLGAPPGPDPMLEVLAALKAIIAAMEKVNEKLDQFNITSDGRLLVDT